MSILLAFSVIMLFSWLGVDCSVDTRLICYAIILAGGLAG